MLIDGLSLWQVALVALILQLTLGPLLGALVGWVGGHLVERSAQRGWMNPIFQRMSAMSLEVLAFAFAEMVQGNGSIAAFVAGLVFSVQTVYAAKRVPV